jgi:hypothetical protein
MRTLRTLHALVVVCALTAVAGSAVAGSGAQLAAPAGLKPFLLRVSEPAAREFPRTPSFSWRPVRGATRYEFELAKAPTFTESSLFWSASDLRTPAASVPLSLPWLTGTPYAAYARVRAVTEAGVTPWSDPYGFNVRWATVPEQVDGAPGLSRWKPVEGATSYDVWFPDLKKVVATRTNAVDHREFYAFHPSEPFMGTVRWRVRAVRAVYGKLPSGLPRVSYGPWSRLYTSTNPPPAPGGLTALEAVSEETASTASRPRLHRLTPGFAFRGQTAGDGADYGLYRVYVFSDRDCVNVVYRGAVVGSPAYAPRTTGPLALPKSTDELASAPGRFLKDGSEGKTFMADTAAVQTTESDKPPAAPADAKAGGAEGDAKAGAKTGTEVGAAEKQAPAGGVDEAAGDDEKSSLPSTPLVTGAPVDLWDSGWPNGRFYWTVVAVTPVVQPTFQTTLVAAAAVGQTSLTIVDTSAVTDGATLTVGSGATAEVVTVDSVSGTTATLKAPLRNAHAVGAPVVVGSSVEYHDVELPQDACAAGRIASFGKASPPALAGERTAFASGLSPKGRVVAAAGARPFFYGAPLVAWQPVLGADQYQVEWSRTRYPWRKEGEQVTYATSAILPLAPGGWYYRVRGINFFLPGSARAMSWSQIRGIVVARPRFVVVAGDTTAGGVAVPKGWRAVDRPRFSLALPKAWHERKGTAGFHGVAAQGATVRASVDVAVARAASADPVAWRRAALAQARRLRTASAPVASWVTLPGGRALRLTYARRTDGGVVRTTRYVWVTKDRRAFMLTLGVRPADAAAQTGTLRRIARTFRHA